MEFRLIVMRHAKSSWKSGAQSDHARPLNQRGRRDAPRVGRRLHELGWVPQRILSSDAARTRETYELLHPQLGDEVEVCFLRSFYEGSLDDVCAELAAVPETITSLLVLGHNPRCQELVAWLTGRHQQLTTANAALLEAVGDSWRDVVAEPGCWTLCDVVRPKSL